MTLRTTGTSSPLAEMDAHPPPLEEIVSSALGISSGTVTDNLAYRDIAEWDSLAHVRLMLKIKNTYDVEITSELVSNLTTVGSIRAFLDGGAAPEGGSRQSSGDGDGTAASAKVHRGLAGINFDRSAITNVDAAGNTLRYRGYSVDELATRSNFEETAYLLIRGHLPRADEMAAFARKLRASRPIPAPAAEVLSVLAGTPPFLALQAAVAALGAARSQDADPDITAVAQLPTLVGALHRLRSGKAPVEPDPGLGHAANLLAMIRGVPPDPEEAAALEEVLVILADHGSSASTFTARVAVSTNAGVHAALASAIGAFSGALHGGAVDRVIAMAEEIETPAAAARFVQRRLERKDVVYGFGHRVYRTADPRSRRLRFLARKLSANGGDKRILDVLEAIPPALREHASLGLDVNVDFYASAVFEALRLPRDLFGPVFFAARTAGLVAHCREQRANNVLIRPQLLYQGAAARAYGERAPA